MSSETYPSPDYYLYRRQLEANETLCNHFVLDGESICHSSVIVPESVSTIPIEDISTSEWENMLTQDSDFCSLCEDMASSSGMIPDQFEDDATTETESPFESKTEEIPDGEVRPPVEGYHIDYRKATKLNGNPRDHIVKGDESLCDYNVRVNREKSLKPLENVSIDEWALLLGKSSNLCRDCCKAAEYDGILPEEVPEEPEYICSYCNESAEKVDLGHFARVYHGTDITEPICRTDRGEYEQWRRHPSE